jgi:predicted nucleotidyltransferase
MVSRRSIAELSASIVRAFRPERIILFGSYAYGRPSPDSDVDLLVVMPYRGHSARKAAEILEEVSPRMSVDLLVRTPKQVRQRLAWNDFFMREIVERGKVLYAARRSRVG